ncbi:MAG: hypothetical protein KBC62_02250 [Candidatus Pacebacteria bacterium]|nr:hypothetical protein [Candidatus Paceibacterota bacterium]
MFLNSSSASKSVFIIAVFAGVLMSVSSAIAFTEHEQAVIDQIKGEQELQKQKIQQVENYKIAEAESIKNLMTAADLKKEVADEKQKAYESAINQLKWWISGVGFVLLCVLMAFGLVYNKELKDKKKELQEEFDKNSEKLQREVDKEIDLIKKENRLNVQEELAKLRDDYKKEFHIMLGDVFTEIKVLDRKIGRDDGDGDRTDLDEDNVLADGSEPTF